MGKVAWVKPNKFGYCGTCKVTKNHVLFGKARCALYSPLLSAGCADWVDPNPKKRGQDHA